MDVDVSTTSSASPAAALRRRDRRWLRSAALGFGLALLAGAGTVCFLVGSRSVPQATRQKVGSYIPFLDSQWRYIQSCPGVVSVNDYGDGAAGDKKAVGEPVQLVYDNRPAITMFGDSITEQSFNPELLGFSALLANA